MRMLRCFQLSALAGVLVAGLTYASTAGAQTFDFEELTLNGNPTTVSSVTSTKGGLTVNIAGQNGSNFSVWDVSTLQGPFSWGIRSLYGSDFVNPGGPIVFNFSAPVSLATLEAGDLDFDSDSPITLTAFSGLNGTGANLGSDSKDWPFLQTFESGVAPVSLTVNGVGIQSLILTSGGSVPESIYFDNLVVRQTSAVPEPAANSLMACLILSGAAFLIRRRA